MSSLTLVKQNKLQASPFLVLNFSLRGINKMLTQYSKESIPIGCVLLSCQLYVFWWLAQGISSGKGISQVPKQVSCPGPWTYSPFLLEYSPPRHTHPSPLEYSPLDIPTPGLAHTPPPHYSSLPILGYPPPVDGMRDSCENITFHNYRR